MSNAVRYVIPVSLSGHSFVLSIGAMLSVIPVSLSGHSFVLSIGREAYWNYISDSIAPIDRTNE
jgi:uncharacterized transporter YbjL